MCPNRQTGVGPCCDEKEPLQMDPHEVVPAQETTPAAPAGAAPKATGKSAKHCALGKKKCIVHNCSTYLYLSQCASKYQNAKGIKGATRTPLMGISK